MTIIQEWKPRRVENETGNVVAVSDGIVFHGLDFSQTWGVPDKGTQKELVQYIKSLAPDNFKLRYDNRDVVKLEMVKDGVYGEYVIYKAENKEWALLQQNGKTGKIPRWNRFKQFLKGE